MSSQPIFIQGTSLHKIIGNKNDKRFKKVVPGKGFKFPDDHYEHNDYKMEWRYFNERYAYHEIQQCGISRELFQL